jgi:hypothetical protein
MADNDGDQESDEEGDMSQFFSQVSQFIQVWFSFPSRVSLKGQSHEKVGEIRA